MEKREKKEKEELEKGAEKNGTGRRQSAAKSGKVGRKEGTTTKKTNRRSRIKKVFAQTAPERGEKD